MIGLLIAAGVASTPPANPASMKTILSCQLESGSQVQLQSQADPVQDGDRFYLTLNGKMDDALVDIPGANYVGKLVLSKCVDHVLIFAISYGAPYFKGRVLRSPAETTSLQNIDFSEKSLPTLIYLNKWETKLVIPNIGYEVTSKYLVYRTRAGKGQDESATPTDSLPSSHRHRVIKIAP